MIFKNRKILSAPTIDAEPIGTVKSFLGTLAQVPIGYLALQGQQEKITRYPDLYALCGNRFTPSGTTADIDYFYLPDLRGRTIVGYNLNETEFNTIGKLFGSKTHTLTSAQLASHTHTRGTMNITGQIEPSWTDGSGGGIIMYNQSNGALYNSRTRDGFWANSTSSGSSGSYMNMINFDASRNWSGETSSVGSNVAHNIIQPSIALIWIVKAEMIVDVKIENIYDGLDNESPNKALSASQGKILNDKITATTNYAVYKFPIPMRINATTPTYIKELTVTTKKGNPVFLSICGDNNPLTTGSAWFYIRFYRNETLVALQLCEVNSEKASTNNPFSLQYLDVVPKGTYIYKVEFVRGAGECQLDENGAAETPQFIVFEI